jgi:predicted component of type VI protein secretion system
VPELVVLNGVAKGTIFVLGDVPAVVGRSPEAHLRIGDPWISSMHAMFERRDDGLWVVDLESRNGVFVGGERVSEARVPDGTVVRLGRTEVQVAAGRARTSELPPVDGEAPPTPARRETSRAEGRRGPGRHNFTPVGHAHAPERPPLFAADATVLRIAVDPLHLEPTAASARLLRDALDAAASAAADAGAAVGRLAGVGILAAFGLDDPAQADAAAALEAARAARAAVREAGGVALRAGIARGPVLAGRPAGRAELTVLGQAADRAERLVALARPGELLVGADAAAGMSLARVGEVRVGDLVLDVFRDEAP